jgi:pimeloyl-ACP methyl ester carboxylesterase
VTPLFGCCVVDHGLADSLPLMAEQLLANAPDRFAIAGHSMGGRVALEVVRQAPERVTHLGLFDTGYLPKLPGNPGEQEALKRYALLEIAQQEGVRAMAKEWVQGMVAAHRLQDPTLLDAIIDMFDRKGAAHFAAQINALLARPDGSDVLCHVAMPALVLCGAQDQWSSPSQHHAISELIPARPGVVEIAAAGHMAPMEAPERVLKAMLDWLL